MARPDDPMEALCGRLLELIVEAETLRSLVVSMAMAVPVEWLPAEERRLLDEALAVRR